MARKKASKAKRPKKAIGKIPGGYKLSIRAHTRPYRPGKAPKRTKAGRFTKRGKGGRKPSGAQTTMF